MEFTDDFLENLRIKEEYYAQNLSGKKVRVTFTSGDYSFTDGSVIIVNPFLDNIYKNTEALRKTEEELYLTPKFSVNEEHALRLITRLQIIHESLHVRYSDIPSRTLFDENAYSQDARILLNTINGIIEDSYIENVGCTMDKVLEQYLRFYRLLQKNVYKPFIVESVLDDYLHYMARYTLFPMILGEPSDEIWEYVEKTKALFLEAAVTSDPKARYVYTDKIFDVVMERLRSFGEHVSGGGELSDVQGKSKTHTEADLAGRKQRREPEHGEVGKRLFEDMMKRDISPDHVEMNHMYFNLYEDDGKRNSYSQEVKTRGLGISDMHRGISLKVIRTENYKGYRSIYDDIYRTYHGVIHNYRARIDQLLHIETETKLDKCYLGSAIDSKRLSDVKKRYWYKKLRDEDMPELSVIFMIDCSYSMSGERMQAVRRAMIIMNEVLKGQGIDYAMFGHTAIHRKPEVEHNLVMDFNSKQSEKYNIMLLSERDGSREGISLVWANDYLARHASTKHRLIVAISDGEPNHFIDSRHSCEPPVSVRDARSVVKEIERTGTHVIAVALEAGGKPCYDKITSLYDHVIECWDLSRLPQQLLELISRELS